jgi:hypothetical protein
MKFIIIILFIIFYELNFGETMTETESKLMLQLRK